MARQHFWIYSTRSVWPTANRPSARTPDAGLSLMLAALLKFAHGTLPFSEHVRVVLCCTDTVRVRYGTVR